MQIFIKSDFAKHITLGFATAITLYPFVVVRKHTKLSKTLVVHEKIHLQQQTEMLILAFYIWYFLEYLFRYIVYRNHYLAYKNISFEKEAYENENDVFYLQKRKKYAWFSYL